MNPTIDRQVKPKTKRGAAKKKVPSQKTKDSKNKKKDKKGKAPKDETPEEKEKNEKKELEEKKKKELQEKTDALKKEQRRGSQAFAFAVLILLDIYSMSMAMPHYRKHAEVN